MYLGARTVRAVDRHLRARATHRWAHLDAVFVTQRGRLSTDGARDRIKIRGVQAGSADLHPHRFRHTFAHDFLMSGGQERDLKRLAGWSSDVMLERYGASAADARARGPMATREDAIRSAGLKFAASNLPVAQMTRVSSRAVLDLTSRLIVNELEQLIREERGPNRPSRW